MARQPRLDAPGALHHVMGRGIEKAKIFRSDIAPQGPQKDARASKKTNRKHRSPKHLTCYSSAVVTTRRPTSPYGAFGPVYTISNRIRSGDSNMTW